jgi:hypothetical protein
MRAGESHSVRPVVVCRRHRRVTVTGVRPAVPETAGGMSEEPDQADSAMWARMSEVRTMGDRTPSWTQPLLSEIYVGRCGIPL